MNLGLPAREPLPAPPTGLPVAALFDRHAPFVHRVAQRLTGSAAAADDVVQEVFLVAHAQGSALVDEHGIRTWLYRCTVNVSRQRRRASRRYDGAVDRFGAEAAPGPGTPEIELGRRQNAERVRSCIAALSEPHREVLVLFELEGVEGAEIAEILEIPLNTVWSRLRLAREAFRPRWLQLQGGHP